MTYKLLFSFVRESNWANWNLLLFRKASPVPESVVLHIDHLSRNVNEAHLKEIFGELISSSPYNQQIFLFLKNTCLNGTYQFRILISLISNKCAKHLVQVFFEETYGAT